MNRSDCWQWIVIGALVVSSLYSLDGRWQIEQAQAQQLKRIWGAELEVQELRSQIKREPETEPERPCIWDSHLVDLRRREPQIHVFCWHPCER